MPRKKTPTPAPKKTDGDHVIGDLVELVDGIGDAADDADKACDEIVAMLDDGTAPEQLRDIVERLSGAIASVRIAVENRDDVAASVAGAVDDLYTARADADELLAEADGKIEAAADDIELGVSMRATTVGGGIDALLFSRGWTSAFRADYDESARAILDAIEAAPFGPWRRGPRLVTDAASGDAAALAPYLAQIRDLTRARDAAIAARDVATLDAAKARADARRAAAGEAKARRDATAGRVPESDAAATIAEVSRRLDALTCPTVAVATVLQWLHAAPEPATAPAPEPKSRKAPRKAPRKAAAAAAPEPAPEPAAAPVSVVVVIDPTGRPVWTGPAADLDRLLPPSMRAGCKVQAA